MEFEKVVARGKIGFVLKSREPRRVRMVFPTIADLLRRDYTKFDIVGTSEIKPFTSSIYNDRWSDGI